MTVLRAGLAYWAIVFAAGFVLGTLRVLLLVPRLGETAAVILELPLMLTVSWFAANWMVGHWRLPSTSHALQAGLVAFVVLMAAEAILAVALFGKALPVWAREQLIPPGAFGLAGQVAFAAMPAIARIRRMP